MNGPGNVEHIEAVLVEILKKKLGDRVQFYYDKNNNLIAKLSPDSVPERNIDE